jgi:hypothetical protein
MSEAANDNRPRIPFPSIECDFCDEDVDGTIVLCRKCAERQGRSLIVGAAQGLECERCRSDWWLTGRVYSGRMHVRCSECWGKFDAL